MSLDIFFTSQNQTSVAGAGKPTAASAGAGLAGGADLNFMDMILGLLKQEIQTLEVHKPAEEKTEDKDIQDGLTALLSYDNPSLDEEAGLDIARILAENPEIEEQVMALVEDAGLEPMEALQHTIALNKEAFDKILKPLTGEVLAAEDAQDGKPRLLNLLWLKEKSEMNQDMSKLEQTLLKIEELKAANDPALINLNLTPEQLATLEQAQGEIAEYVHLKDVSPEELNSILSGFAGLMPIIINKAPQAPVLVTPLQIVQSAQVNTAAMPAEGKAMQQIATKLNALDVGAGEADAIENIDADADADFKDLLDKAFGKPQGDDKAIIPANSNAPSSKAAPQAGANPTSLQFQTLPATFEGSQLLSFDPAQGLPESFAPIATNSLQMNVLTNLASQAPHAGAMNPVMQTLAAQIQRNMGNGQTTEFRLQLDPPELGRVEVQMSFGKDKSLKTGIVVEKPETYMMLQRDAQMLERTLQNMGLDTEGGISLELAEQGFDFDRDNSRGGGHDKGGTGAGGEDETDIIESTMTWHVDPNTGHTRYDIWA